MTQDSFYINSLGETEKTSGSANEEDVRKHFQLPEKRKLTQRHFDLYFKAEEKAKLSEREYALMQNWHRLSQTTSALFRIQARIREDYRGNQIDEITLTTEVIELARVETYWNDVYAFALDTNARIEWESTSKNIEHSWRTNPDGSKIPGSDKYGDRYGKLERQVGIVWTFAPRTTVGDMKRHISRMKREMLKRKLGHNWVSVL